MGRATIQMRRYGCSRREKHATARSSSRCTAKATTQRWKRRSSPRRPPRAASRRRPTAMSTRARSGSETYGTPWRSGRNSARRREGERLSARDDARRPTRRTTRTTLEGRPASSTTTPLFVEEPSRRRGRRQTNRRRNTNRRWKTNRRITTNRRVHSPRRGRHLRCLWSVSRRSRRTRPSDPKTKTALASTAGPRRSDPIRGVAPRARGGGVTQSIAG